MQSRAPWTDSDATLAEKPQQRPLADPIALGEPGGGCTARVLGHNPLDHLGPEPSFDPLRDEKIGRSARVMVRQRHTSQLDEPQWDRRKVRVSGHQLHELETLFH
jgi:hypothetical protein